MFLFNFAQVPFQFGGSIVKVTFKHYIVPLEN